jgi:hypothetical protein
VRHPRAAAQGALPDRLGRCAHLKQPESTDDYATRMAKLPLETLEAMRDNARKLEQDDEVRELLTQKRALTELNRERKKRGEPPVSLAKFLNQ